MENAIVVDNVSKKFRLPHEKNTTLFQKLIGFGKRQYNYEEFWALKDIGFEVKKGEALGIMGKNGSGKSVLLQILAGVLYPDQGLVSLSGKVASLLELGVGFQQELTAKENIYIYSSVLGLNRKQVKQVYKEILDFAELKRFENMKLKNFSSGMYMRLAFSIAIYAVPNILLIDEVFSVGDASFQKKCRAKIEQFKQEGKTIILASHSLDLGIELCQRSILLHEGKLIKIGDSRQVTDYYLNMLRNPRQVKSLKLCKNNNYYKHAGVNQK